MITKAYQLQAICLNANNQLEVKFGVIAWTNYKEAESMKDYFKTSLLKTPSIVEVMEINIITLEVR